MASFTLNWIPAGGENSQNQEIQYRIHGSSAWVTYQKLGPLINTIQLNNLQDNTLYEFQVVDNCAYGGPVSSPSVTGIKIVCPTIAFSNTYNIVHFAFNQMGGSVDQYFIYLYDNNNNQIASLNIKEMNPVIAGSFTGVNPNTAYQIQVIPSASGNSQVCPMVSTSTPPPPVCDAPTNVTATLN